MCSAWIKHHDADDLEAKAGDAWLAGFLTGYNAFADPRTRKTSFLPYDMANLPSAVTVQCRKQPEMDVYTAAMIFIDTLKRADPASRR